jgi:hypothetical protein
MNGAATAPQGKLFPSGSTLYTIRKSDLAKIIVLLMVVLFAFFGTLAAQTVLLDEDFETNSISSISGNYPYKSTNSCSSIFGWSTSTSYSAGCSACSNQAARIRITSSCTGFKTAYLYIGTFTPTTATVNIEFDYGYRRASGVTSSFRVVLRNLTTSTETNLVYHASTAQNQSYSGTSTVVPGNTYEIRAVFFASDYYNFSHGATLDNIVVTNPCTSPIATLTTIDDCGNNRFQVQAVVTSTGSASGVDIDVDGSTLLSNVGPGTYLLPSPGTYYNTGASRSVSVNGSSYGGCPGPTAVLAGCQADVCADAIDILGQSAGGDLAAANIDAPPALLPNFLSCGNGNTIARCGGSTHFAYDYTDYTDLWYQVDIPDGSDEFTVSFSSLTGPVMVLPYTGACASLTQLPIGNTASSTTGGSCPLLTADGSFTFVNVASYSTAPIYLRVIPHDNGTFGSAGCSGNSFNYASFTLTASAPQPNDVCADAPDITLNYGGAAAIGDLSLAGDEGTALPSSGTCGLSPLATGGEDLWLEVNMPATGPVKNIEFSLRFDNAGESVYAYLYDGGCFGYSSPEDCRMMSSTNAGDSVTVTFDTGALLLTSRRYLIRLLRPSANGLSGFSASAQIVDRNNSCGVFNGVVLDHRLHDGSNPVSQVADFVYSSNSGAGLPGGGQPTAGNRDLWFNFDPVLTTDANGLQTWSGYADVDISGLGSGEEMLMALYRRQGYSGNCTNFAGDLVTSRTVNSNGTIRLNCLDYTHGSTGVGDGYLLRLVQVSAGAPLSTTISATPAPVAPPANDICSTIFNGTSATYEGGFYDITNDTISGDFTRARQCEGISSGCSGNNLTHPRDLWYLLTLPSASCPDLTASTRITSAEIWYDAGSSFRDAYVFVFAGCDGDSLIDCQSMDGAGSTMTVEGLEPGRTYLVRVMPHLLNSNADYVFDIGTRWGPVQPCNDQPASAERLTGISTGFDRSACPTLTLSAQGATETANLADGKHDVWFSFLAPNNGGPYVQQEGYLSFYLESVSGHTISIEVYDVATANVANNRLGSATTDSYDEARLHLGHLIPGEEYFLRVAHSEQNSSLNNVDVQYRLCLYQDQTISTCPQSGSNLVAGGVECNTSCSKYYKIDLPEGHPSAYYRVEVVGDGIPVDGRMRYQGMDSPSNEGNLTDIDHPCNAGGLLPLESFGALGGPAACNGGSGFWKVYNMIGPTTGQRNYYYLEVYDPVQVVGCGGLDICEVRIFGPYSTRANAEAGGPTDVACTVALPVDWLSFEGKVEAEEHQLRWLVDNQVNVSHYELERSADGVTFAPVGEVEAEMAGGRHAYELGMEHEGQSWHYRVRSVDLDGAESLSETIFLEGKAMDLELVRLWPNPVQETLHLEVRAAESMRVKALVVDALGKRVLQTEWMAGPAGDVHLLPVAGLAGGVYHLQLQGNGEVISRRLVVQ